MSQKSMRSATFCLFSVVVVSISPLLRRTLTLTHRHQRDAATVADSNVHTRQLRSTAPVTCTHREGGSKHPSICAFSKDDVTHPEDIRF